VAPPRARPDASGVGAQVHPASRTDANTARHHVRSGIVTGVTVVGVRGHLVAVEAHVGRGLPSLTPDCPGLPPRTFADGHGTGRARQRHRPPRIGVVLLADLDQVDRPRESCLVRVRRVATGDDHARRVASSLHWMSSSTCWQRMTPSFPPPLTPAPVPCAAHPSVPQTCRKRNSTDRYGLIPTWPLSRGFLQRARIWCVRVPPSQGGDTGSNPVGTTCRRLFELGREKSGVKTSENSARAILRSLTNTASSTAWLKRRRTVGRAFR
jgi:hypothetical protein